MGRAAVCLSFSCGAFWGFLFWYCRRFIPLSDNRVVGSGSLGQIAHFMSPTLGSVRRWCWAGFLGLPIGFVLGLLRCGLGRWLLAVPLIMAGWCALVTRCSYRLACTPFTGSALCSAPVLEFRDHTGSPAIPDGECGVK